MKQLVITWHDGACAGELYTHVGVPYTVVLPVLVASATGCMS